MCVYVYVSNVHPVNSFKLLVENVFVGMHMTTLTHIHGLHCMHTNTID